MEFTTNSGIWGTMFGVPHVVADNFLKLATEKQIKVLLYILRCAGRTLSDEEISRNTGVPILEVTDCVLFWQQVNVLDEQSRQTTTALQNTPTQTETADVLQQSKSESGQTIVPRQKQELKPSEITDILKSSSDIAQLFKIVESFLGTLNHTQQNSLIWMYNYLGLKKEVILTLVQYCITIGKTNSGYIEKIACGWAENDINSLDAAQEEVQRLTQYNDFIGMIMKKFEMPRRPTTKQKEFISVWQKEGFSIDLIGYAYEKTIEQINKLSFEYINKILASWKESGFTTVRSVRDSEISYKKNKKTIQGSPGVSDVDKYKVVINKF